MKIGELLREGDPLQSGNESYPSVSQRNASRQMVLKVAAETGGSARRRFQSATFWFAMLALVVATMLARAWSPSVTKVHAAVSFEIRLAEDAPGPGLREAKVSGSDRAIYLHDRAIVTNSDIESARVVEGARPSQYYIEVKFDPRGAGKMERATRDHIGRPLAMLVDGKVSGAPTVRSAISGSALITGNFTKTEAEKIASGIR